MFRRLSLMVLAVSLLVSLLTIGGSRSSAATTGTVKATVDNAIYTWWAQPLAVNDGAYTWVGSIARMGTVRLSKVNRSTGDVQTVGLKQIAPDDHNTPAIAFDNAQPNLVVFYTGHNASSSMSYHTVNRDTMAVGSEQQLAFSGNITYAQVLRNGSKLVLFTRVSSSSWHYRVSEDFGQTWGSEQVFISAPDMGQVYIVVKPVTGDADTNTLAFYGHPTSSPLRNVEYAQLSLSTGDITWADGQTIGNLYTPGGPNFGPGDLHQAITPSTGYKVRLLDIGTIDGAPAISYAVWQGETGPAEYKVKLYRNGQWSTPPWELATGAPFGYTPAIHYVGGMVIGRNDRLYSSRKNNATGVWYLEQWRWSANQNTFVFEREVARDNTKPLVRPYVPARTGQTEVIAQRLDKYASFTDYDADILVF